MKKFWTVLTVIALIVGGVFFYRTTTPEYALAKTIQDVHDDGMEGLKKHLTPDTARQIEAIEDWTEQNSLSGVLAALTQNTAVSVLKTKMSETQWTVSDVRKGKEQADVVIGFDYRSHLTGTVEITMLRDGLSWKIDSVSLPHFTKLSLW